MNGSVHVTDFLLSGKDPSRVALRAPDRDYTYGQLQRAAVRVSQYLHDAGGKKGDRAVLIGENSFFWVAAYLGTLRAGLVSVPLPANIAPDELGYIVENTEPSFAFLEPGLGRKYRASLNGLQVLTDLNHVGDVKLDEPPVPMLPDELAALMFTSGSTGKPRGVMVSHRNIMANTASIVEYLELTADDRIMAVLPFHYCFGTSLLHTHLRVGGSLVIGSRFLYPETVLDRMAETECTGFAGVPSHFQILLRKSSLRRRAFPRLRYVQQAGGHLAAPLVRDLSEALPSTRVFINYGQTEGTARLASLSPELAEAKADSIGRGIPGVTLRVQDEAGKDVAPGDVGEIVAQGDNVALGYWRAPEESAATFRDGRLFTGDLATVDEDGLIYLAGRTKDFIKCRGERVSCQQIEEVLLAFAGLSEAAVTGMADEVFGEALRAFVVARESGCPASCDWQRCKELRERLTIHCRERMPASRVPKEIIAMPALPRNSSGKLLKGSLEECC